MIYWVYDGDELMAIRTSWGSVEKYMKTQQNNLRNNILLRYNNKTQTISQWADELCLNKSKLYYRFHIGWNITDILFGRNK